MSTLLITITHGRPKALELLARCVGKQTTTNFDWLIVSDNFEKYTTPKLQKVKNIKVITREHDPESKLPSICQNWLAALDYVDTHEKYTEVIIMEDDDWYHSQYIVETLALLDRAELAGWHEDAYYYVLTRRAKRWHNVGHASLAATAFRRSVLPYARECVMRGEVFIDLLLWKGISETAYMPQPPITLGTGQVINAPPMQYQQTIREWKGSRILADNFTAQLWGEPARMHFDADGRLVIVSNEPEIDSDGNIVGEHPRHIGLKEPWHAGTQGLSKFGHQFHGGPDPKGKKLREWMGDAREADQYLRVRPDLPTNPHPAGILITMDDDGSLN